MSDSWFGWTLVISLLVWAVVCFIWEVRKDFKYEGEDE